MPPSGKTLIIHLLRIGLGLFFFIVGIIKLRDLDAFTEDIFNYQILFPPYDGYAAYLVAWLEVIAGLAVVIGLQGLRGGLILIAGMLAAFITALSIAAAKGLNINCGCFGSSEEPTNFPLHIGMNTGLLILTLGLFWYQTHPRPKTLFAKSKLNLPRKSHRCKNSSWSSPPSWFKKEALGQTMTFFEKLTARTSTVGNLCIGLDPRVENHHNRLSEVEDYLIRLIGETSPHAAAFKPNSAYFESLGSEGFALLERTVARVPDDIPIVLDVKRSDIGETQRRYAIACFEHLRADAVTLNPFMGYDSLEPFLDYPGGKGLYLLALTSNSGSADFQRQTLDGKPIYQRVADYAARAASQNRSSSVGLVVGLTNAGPEVLARVPDIPLLVPGLGAQGGDLANLASSGRKAPNLINVSRGITYPGDGQSPAELAKHYREQIATALGNS